MPDLEGVDQLLTEEVRGLAAAFGVELVEVPVRPLPEVSIVGAINFRGEAVNGAVTCVASAATWRALAPWATASDFQQAADYDDYAAEVSNLFAGKLKSALLRKGVMITLGLPRCALSDPSGPHRWHTMQTATGNELHVRLEATFTEDFALDDEAPPASIVGDFIMF